MNVGARSITTANAGMGWNTIGHKRANRNSPLIHLNVAGTEFFVHKSDLLLHPKSLLGSQRLEKYFEPTINAYFFDRHRIVFEHIASFYQTGKLCFPRELNKDLIKRELKFFGLELSETDNITRVDKIIPIVNSLKARIHMFMVDPRSSVAATVWAGLDIILILVSVVTHVLETEPAYQDAFKNPQHPMYPYFMWGDMVVAAFFSIDFLLRAVTWPSVTCFVRNVHNVMDFLSLLPFYIWLLFTHTKFILIESGKVFRMFRIFRVIKFFKYFADMFLIIDFVCNAWQVLTLVSMLTAMLIVMFGSILYYAEIDTPHNQFYSITQGMWWSMVTITTVGYGDVFPTSIAGRFFGSVLVIMSMVVLTLPMTVVIAKFNRAYSQEQRGREKMMIVDSDQPSDGNLDQPRVSIKDDTTGIIKENRQPGN